MAQAAYKELSAIFSKRHHLSHAASMLQWDEMVNLPPGGVTARGDAKAVLAVLMHDLLASPDTSQKLEAVETAEDFATALSQWEKANVREIREQINRVAKVPPEHVARASKHKTKAQASWAKNRAANDWQAFLPDLKEMVEIAKQEAKYLAEGTDMSLYEALLNVHEPGMKVATLNKIFSEVKEWLPELVKQVKETHQEPLRPQEGKFPVPQQKALSEEVMRDLLKFDFTRGRLDVSKHPFCGLTPEDVRLTTRYSEDALLEALFATIHETGHARYQQNLPQEVLDQPVGGPRSAGIHESQSLFHEMQLARSPAFVSILAPRIKEHFNEEIVNSETNSAAFEAKELYRFLTSVKPSKIRVYSDELTYPLHVILRYEIELQLIENDLPCEEIPKLWDQKMKEYLGIDTTGDFKDGCMQDIHWSIGYIGFFPTYALGAMYAAQWMATVRKALGGTEEIKKIIDSGDLSQIYDWLKENIWSKGCFFANGEELAIAASGEPLNSEYYKKHLTDRFLHKTW